jgi:hypothetical protein
MMDMKFVFAIVLIGAIASDVAEATETTATTTTVAPATTATTTTTTTTTNTTTASAEANTTEPGTQKPDGKNMAMDAVPLSPLSYLLTAALTILFAVKA